MLLESIKYTRLKGKSKEWGIDGHDGKPVHFGNFNLIVGKNSAGKTHTLAVIREIANLLSGRQRLSEVRFVSARYELSFREGEEVYDYIIEYENRIVVNEQLLVDGQKKIDRASKQLYSEEADSWVEADIADSDIMVSLHAAKKYPYLKKLYIWGLTLKNTAFSNHNEKNNLVDDLLELEAESPSGLKDTALLLYSYTKGLALFGDEFGKRIIDGMNSLGYGIQSVEIQKIARGYALCVQEESIDDVTDQLEMSQGMFSALSFLIHLNFALMNKISVPILIDNLGEGLDFNRSSLLIDLLIVGVKKEPCLQLFITTNDRYIMNRIPLDYWSIIERAHKKSIFYNYYNSKAVFDDFKYTGLNNFDFLATDFYVRGFEDVDVRE
ncbi:ATP-binding protein [Viscerimonas tarda]